MEQKQAIKIERIHPIESSGPTKAFCDLIILDTFRVKGLRVVKGSKGLFVSMPQDQGRDGKWYDTFYPVSKEYREGLEKMILDEYNSQK